MYDEYEALEEAWEEFKSDWGHFPSNGEIEFFCEVYLKQNA